MTVRFVKYSALVGVPHIICDGTTRRSTVLTLSHWPASATPPELLADLSAEVVLRYLRSPAHHVDVDAVSNDHLDLDGLMAVWAVVNPEAALADPTLVAEVARAGDFATTTDVRARRVAFALGALRQVDDSYEHLLPAVDALAADIDAHEHLWCDEEAAFARTEEAFAAGRIAIEEDVDLDLAVVTIDDDLQLWGEHAFSILGRAPCHALSLCNRTDRFRILFRHGPFVGFLHRFESWVQYQSRTVLPRVDLSALAEELTARDDHPWTYAWPRMKNPPVPWLASWQATSIPFEELRERLEVALRRAEVTYDAYSTPMRYG